MNTKGKKDKEYSFQARKEGTVSFISKKKNCFTKATIFTSQLPGRKKNHIPLHHLREKRRRNAKNKKRHK